jgi:hypothetical protein
VRAHRAVPLRSCPGAPRRTEADTWARRRDKDLSCPSDAARLRCVRLHPLHSVYDQPDAASVHAQFDKLLDHVTDRLPAVAAHLDAARADLLAFTGFPKPVWRQIWSNNPNERLNKEIRRRNDAGI